MCDFFLLNSISVENFSEKNLPWEKLGAYSSERTMGIKADKHRNKSTAPKMKRGILKAGSE